MLRPKKVKKMIFPTLNKTVSIKILNKLSPTSKNGKIYIKIGFYFHQTLPILQTPQIHQITQIQAVVIPSYKQTSNVMMVTR